MLYFDYNSTSPISKIAKQRIIECADLPLNPSSIHQYGRKAKLILEESRIKIAKMLGLDLRAMDYELTFCSSATEANNIVMLGYAADKILVSATEHPSILKLSQRKEYVNILPVDSNGIVSLVEMEEWLKKNQGQKVVVAIMMANNETGIIQPIDKISKLVHDYGGALHCDMVQVPGKTEFDISKLDIDFITISSHKIGGPLGIGALVHKNKYKLESILIGGGQEKGLRSGTENTFAAVGFEAAAELISDDNYKEEIYRIKELRDYFEDKIRSIADVIIIGENSARLVNTSMINMPGKNSKIQLIRFDMHNIAVSAGSACSSGKVENSHVLRAMSVKDEISQNCIRYSFGSGTNKEDIDKLVEIWSEIYHS